MGSHNIMTAPDGKNPLVGGTLTIVPPGRSQAAWKKPMKRGIAAFLPVGYSDDTDYKTIPARPKFPMPERFELDFSCFREKIEQNCGKIINHLLQ
jgi:hypothetical protein